MCESIGFPRLPSINVLYGPTGSSPTLTSSLTQPTPASFSLTQPTNPPTLPRPSVPPIQAFAGLPVPATGSTAARRTQSAHRTLPQHQHNIQGIRGTPSSSRSLAATQPHRPFPHTAASSTPGSSSSSSSADLAPPGMRRVLLAIVSFLVCFSYVIPPILCLCLPFLSQPGFHTDVFPEIEFPVTWVSTQTSRVWLEHLHRRHQLLLADLPTSGTIWKAVHNLLHSHLQTHTLRFAANPSPPHSANPNTEVEAYDQAPFVFLAMRQRLTNTSAGALLYRFVQSAITEVESTLKNLIKEGKMSNPLKESDPMSQYPLIFVGTHRSLSHSLHPSYPHSFSSPLGSPSW